LQFIFANKKSEKMNFENPGTEMYSVNYIINNAGYTVTHMQNKQNLPEDA